ncbi:major facilitator superfamily domain-containing protein [Fusarium solani]|uniref:Major facilitator superfamily domain-containing protein n=1 Tax=Fusarium solani TaxID=169388 RepID=A0A9P9G5D2_FUSSL|nr:major facilitator superfamily domain-containing protein [Fusarium solani]KAH7232671.1 major facilitator superfamily domain-containing protein [Fusarium solani]
MYRGTYFQAILLGLVSFTQPGIWTAIMSLGGGGQAEPYVVNASNAITYGIMFACAPVSSVVGDIVGVKWVVVFGTLGYAPYSAALYCNSVWGTQWFLMFGAVTCGFSAAALWQGEGTIAVAYPEMSRRGRCISIWLTLNKLGSIIASSIQLGINKSANSTGSISPRTYLVLVGLQCLGLPLSLLISSPHKLVRTDGQKPRFANPNRTWRSELRGFIHQFRRKEVVLLVPAFIASQWGLTYQGNYLATYYTVRARTLASFTISIIGCIANLLTGWWLDTKRVSRSFQGRSLWYFVLGLFTVVWIWNLVIQARWDDKPPMPIDWSDRKYGEGLVVFVLYHVAYETLSIWLFWALGTFDVEADSVSLSMGLLRAGESLGSALSYAVGATRDTSLMANLIISVVMFYVSAPFTDWSSHLIQDRLPNECPSDSTIEDIEQWQETEAKQVNLEPSRKN